MANHLAVASIDPFDPRAIGAYLPTGTTTKSWKDSDNIKFDGVIASDGTFMLMFNPACCNDMPCVWYTNSSGDTSQTTANPNNCSGRQTAQGLAYGFQQLLVNNNAYSSNTYTYYNGPQVRARVVSAGVRVTFSGTTLYDGGVAYALVEPNHENLYNMSVTDIQQYKSCKAQRLATRGCIELTMAPVTRDSMEFSKGLDDIPVTYSRGCYAPGEGLGMIAFNRVPVNSGNNEDNENGYPIQLVDEMRLGRDLSTLVYPLSRRNCAVGSFPMPIANTTISSNSSGVITWGTTPDPQHTGVKLVYGAGATGGNVYYAVYNESNGNWYLYNGSGALVISQSSITVEAFSNAAYPSLPAVLFINAGTAMAGQTVHIEYVVHVEYSGLGVNKKATPNPPDEHGLAVVHAALNEARDVSGQNEHATLRRAFTQAVNKIATTSAPGLIKGLIGAVAPELAPLGDLAVDSLAKRRRLF